jgi:hypothetical protein
MARPLGSTPITGLPCYYGPVRQQTPQRYSAPCGCGRLARSLPPPAPLQPAVSGPAFPRSTQEPQTGLASPTCRAPPGQSAGSRQAHPATFRSSQFRCRLWTFDTSAAIRSRSPSRSPPDTHAGAFSPTLTTLGDQPSAARGGLEPPPARRLRRASHPPSLAQHHSKQGLLPIHLPSCARGATGTSCKRTFAADREPLLMSRYAFCTGVELGGPVG